MSDKNLKGLRSKIDKIDQELYALIQKRASHAVAIGKIKSNVSPKSSFYKPDREAKILRNIATYINIIEEECEIVAKIMPNIAKA